MLSSVQYKLLATFCVDIAKGCYLAVGANFFLTFSLHRFYDQVWPIYIGSFACVFFLVSGLQFARTADEIERKPCDNR